VSLSNLAVSLSSAGRRDEALAPVREAVAIGRRLAEDDPKQFLPDLALSLNNQAVSLREVGERDEAMASIREAVAIRRRLASVGLSRSRITSADPNPPLMMAPEPGEVWVPKVQLDSDRQATPGTAGGG